MKVLILSQYYDPEPIPKPSDLAEELVKRGHTVSVVTGFPNYPSGELYDGYRLALISCEKVRGIGVTRTFEYPYHGRSAIGRILNYGSFMLSAPFGCLFSEDFDVIYVWHPPLTVGVAARIISALRGVPFVYDVQDIWPESAVLSGLLREGPVVRLMSLLEKFIYKGAAQIIVVTEGARENLVSKGVPRRKVHPLPHWVEEGFFSAPPAGSGAEIRRENGWGDRFVALFAGNLGIVQGLETVVLAAEAIREDENVLIAFVGDGADRERLEGLAASKGLGSKVQFLGRRRLDEMPAYLDAADLLLVHLRRSEISNYSIPAKTLAYMASGRPLLMAMEGAAADMVRAAGAGVVIPPEDPVAMAATIRMVKEMAPGQRREMGARGREHILENLTKESVIPMYEGLLKEACGL